MFHVKPGFSDTGDSNSARTLDVPPEADTLFGSSLASVTRYAEILANDGVAQGMIGPREVERLWSRHLINCGLIVKLIPQDAWVVDVGSGAGLPGLVLAIACPDLKVSLLEPRLHRTQFLQHCIDELELTNVEIVRGRAEDWSGKVEADVVTARAVAPLPRLARWCLPLLRPGGQLLAIKGDTAAEELADSSRELRELGADEGEVLKLGTDIGAEPTHVIRVSYRPRGRGF